MKKYINKWMAVAAIAVSATACGDFGDTNLDPEHLNGGIVNYQMVFTNAQHQALGSDWDVWRNGLIYLSQWNQHCASGGNWWGYGVNSFSDGYSSAYWGAVYSGGRGAVRDIQMVIEKWKDDPANAQNYQIARIIRAYIFHRLTDLYGDVPYSEAGQPNKFSYPKYDTQEFIMKDLLNELDEAQANLGSGTASMGAQELFYGGDVAKIRKFANSLMMRIAMRLEKRDIATAKKYVEKAVKNGVITETADNCVLMHTGGSASNDSSEPYAKIIFKEDPGNFFINRTFLDKLQELDDPRIPLIMCVYPTGYQTSETDPAIAANSDPDKQKALPGFYSMDPASKFSIQEDYADEFTADVLSSDKDVYFKKTYSQPNRSTYGDPTGPTFVCTAAQTNLLLAEAVLKGWISGDASSYYKKGVRCAMEQFNTYPSANAKALYNKYLTADAIQEYLDKNPFEQNKEKALEQLGIQYWITCFFDEYETYANWRRTGYPALQEKCSQLKNFSELGNYKGIVRRFAYPGGELQSNSANYQEALKRLGLSSESDFTDTRVWWDMK